VNLPEVSPLLPRSWGRDSLLLVLPCCFTTNPSIYLCCIELSLLDKVLTISFRAFWFEGVRITTIDELINFKATTLPIQTQILLCLLGFEPRNILSNDQKTSRPMESNLSFMPSHSCWECFSIKPSQSWCNISQQGLIDRLNSDLSERFFQKQIFWTHPDPLPLAQTKTKPHGS
jgi:hypothetical protein